MRALVVHAHPEPRSFNAALARAAADGLLRAGHAVETSDLYAMRFNPVASADDFGSRRDPAYLSYALEQRHAFESGALAPDIREEVGKVLRADLVLLVFPIFWFSMPAILKGWVDRVFLSGPFYGGRRIYDQGGLRGKRATVAISLGGRPHMFGPDAVHGEMEPLLRPILRGTLRYVGFDVLPPFVAYHVPYISDGERAAILAAFGRYLATLDARPPLAFPNLDAFDAQLRPKDAPAATPPRYFSPGV